jgi:histidyl-tRNA synthetase
VPETFKAPTGTHDVLPPESGRWQALEATFAALVGRAGYGLLKTPLFEDAGVFHRVGEATDVVRKEMYDFEDKGGRKVALRPEGTASVVRAFVQHRPTAVPWKVWYSAPMFRYERPQAGRYRQHQQLGLEALGSDDPDLDVEVISLQARFYESLGLQRVLLIINSLGDENCKPQYLEVLAAYLAERNDALCDEHRQRAAENPLRVLDCKRKACMEATRNAPRMVDHLCGPCKEHFERVQAGLGSLGIAFAIETRLVRGLDYYTRTTFEFQASALESAQNAIGGGGRYNGLVESLGGPSTPGIGFGSGIERVLLACDAEGVFPTPDALTQVFVVDVVGGEAARDLTASLRGAGIAADRAFDGRSMKSQMKAADRSGARFALLVGEDEVATGSVTLRSLRDDAEQERIPRPDLIDRLRSLLHD